MLRMRLTRVGAKKRPSYRVVVADSRAPRDGRHVDIVGFYDPMTKPSTINIDTERAVKWLQHGAQPTDRVRILLRHAGVLKAHDDARMEAKRARKAQAAEGGEGGGVAEAAQHLASEVASGVATAAGAAAAVAGAVVDVVADAASAVASVATPKRSDESK